MNTSSVFERETVLALADQLLKKDPIQFEINNEERMPLVKLPVPRFNLK